MKIRITKRLPIVNLPEVGSVHEVIRKETEQPRNKRTRLYFIKFGGEEVGVYPNECKVVYEQESEGTKHDANGSSTEDTEQSI